MKFIDGINMLDYDMIKNIIKKIGKVSDKDIYKNYFILLDFVNRNKQKEDLISFLGIAHTVYGWMPTMLKNIDNKIINDEKKMSDIWEKIHSGSLNKEFLVKIKKIVNNSISGGSKLLHFLNPEYYAIFDSRVYKAITNNKHYNYNDNEDKQIDKYITYINKIRELASDEKNMNIIKDEFYKNNAKDSRISNLRFIELCLFFSKK